MNRREFLITAAAATGIVPAVATSLPAAIAMPDALITKPSEPQKCGADLSGLPWHFYRDHDNEITAELHEGEISWPQMEFIKSRKSYDTNIYEGDYFRRGLVGNVIRMQVVGWNFGVEFEPLCSSIQEAAKKEAAQILPQLMALSWYEIPRDSEYEDFPSPPRGRRTMIPSLVFMEGDQKKVAEKIVDKAVALGLLVRDGLYSDARLAYSHTLLADELTQLRMTFDPPEPRKLKLHEPQYNHS